MTPYFALICILQRRMRTTQLPLVVPLEAPGLRTWVSNEWQPDIGSCGLIGKAPAIQANYDSGGIAGCMHADYIVADKESSFEHGNLRLEWKIL